MLERVRKYLRENEGYSDEEIQDLIDAAKADLQLSGVHPTKLKDADPLIKRAITVYCKAHFGYDEQAERFQRSYDSLKTHLTLSIEYTVGDET